MRYRKVYSAVLLFFCFLYLESIAQEHKLIDSTLTQRQDQMLHRQAEVLLHIADSVLQAFPPQSDEPIPRTLALYLLDALFHDVYADRRPPVHDFLKDRIVKAALDIERTQVADGFVIWKMYDHGFIVRSASVTIAFDLIRPEIRLSSMNSHTQDALEKIIHTCDVLFVSHRHTDHADAWVAQRFLKQGKTVIAPPGVWSDQPFYQDISHLERNGQIKHAIPIRDGTIKLEAVIYPGHQGELLNNVPIIYMPEGYCISHNGDQNQGQIAQDSLWMNTIKEAHNLDVLLYNSYMHQRWIPKFNPKLVVSGHENELSHGIHSRHPYWAMHQRLKPMDYPLVVMVWGERFDYRP
ncbi:MAG: hypothetical protein HKN87_10715 [Saprospiraceae bacterium]|nr:hypothetical protein [Saprospiraceae bacterium]